MYNRYKYSRVKKPEVSLPYTNVQNKESIPSINTSYRRSANLDYSSKNKNVNPPKNNNTTQEFVNRSNYRPTKTSQPIESNTSRNFRNIKTNEKNEQSQQVPPTFNRRSYLAPKNNIIEDKGKDNKITSLNDKNNNNENKDDKKNENTNGKKRYFRRFRRDNDNNENKTEEKKIENNEESGTSNSNINPSSKNGYTTGRLVNDSNEDLIKMERKSKEIEVIENEPKKEDNNSINNPKNEQGKGRFRRTHNKTDDNLPQKDIINKKEEFQLDNTNMKNKRSSIATSFVPGSRNNPIKLYNNDLFSEILEVAENNESSIDNNSRINTRKKLKDNNKFNSPLNSNEVKSQENNEINKNEESDINNNKDKNVSKENELNEENDENKNTNKDNNVEEENNIQDNYKDNYKDNNDNNDNNINNYDNNKEDNNIEKNNINDKDNNNEENNITNNNMRKKNIEKSKMDDNEHIIMDNIFNEVEQFNAKTILKGDLAEIYDDLIKKNVDFKDDVFFINLNHFERRVGDCDDRLIMHSFKRFPKEELFQKQYLSSQELIKKYYDRAERIKKENEF